MKPQFAVAVLLSAILGMGGCAKKNSYDNAEVVDDDFPADTASVEDGAFPEGEDFPNEVAPAVAQESNAVAPESATSPALDAAGSGVVEMYTVQPGDTLMKVAFNIYGDIDMWRQLYEMNKDVLSSAKALRPGQQIKYDKPLNQPNISQNGEAYLIKDGDTLGKISNDVYATTKKWRKLYENNRELIKDPNKIYSGFYLFYQITEEERQWAESHRSGVAQSGHVDGRAAPRATASDGTVVESAPAPTNDESESAALPTTN